MLISDRALVTQGFSFWRKHQECLILQSHLTHQRQGLQETPFTR